MSYLKPFLVVGAVSALAGHSVRADLVTDWNDQILAAIKAGGTPPPKASYNLAVFHAAIYDSVNGIHREFQPYQVGGMASSGASQQAAINEAAYQILTTLYPAQSGTFTPFYNNAMSALPADASKVAGQAWGSSVASQILAGRVGDGSATAGTYTTPAAPGIWQPTPPANAPALLPNWGNVTPFGVVSGSQFQAPTPPSLTSAEYAAAYNEVKELGSATSATRTADQTEIAKFWADGGGTITPPGHWNYIAQDVVDAANLSLVQSARTFVALNVAMADAGITAWDTKYAYDFWRPVTAIRLGDTDGNAGTLEDPTWTPLLTTPPFPSYTSGHSTFSGAAAGVLSELFGDSYAFSTPSYDTTLFPVPVVRNFSSFQEAAEEAGKSRIYGGIHFEFDNVAGLTAGAQIGAYIMENHFAPVPEVTTVGTVFAGMLAVGGIVRRRRQVETAK